MNRWKTGKLERSIDPTPGQKFQCSTALIFQQFRPINGNSKGRRLSIPIVLIGQLICQRNPDDSPQPSSSVIFLCMSEKDPRQRRLTGFDDPPLPTDSVVCPSGRLREVPAQVENSLAGKSVFAVDAHSLIYQVYHA